MKFFLFLSAISFSSFANADFAIEVGKVNCRVVGNPKMSVEVQLFSGESVNINVLEFGDITLNTYNEKTGENEAKQWQTVPVSSIGRIEESIFENEKVYLYYYDDPMSDVSELRYDGKTLALQCELLDD